MRRSHCIVMAVGLLLGFSGIRTAEGCNPGEPNGLAEWRRLNPSRSERHLLVYDHESGKWQGFVVKGTGCAPWEDGFKLDFTGKPSVQVDSPEDLLVLVADTNPMLYGVKGKAPTQAAIPELEKLQQLAGLLGGMLATSLRAQALELREKDLQAQWEAEGKTLAEQRKMVAQLFGTKAETQGPVTPALAVQDARLSSALKSLADALLSSATSLREGAETGRKGFAGLKEEVEGVKARQTGAQVAIQAMEFGQAGDFRFLDRTDTGTIWADLQRAFDEAQTAREKVTTHVCTTRLGELAELILLKVDPASGKPADKQIAERRIGDLLFVLTKEPSVVEDGCKETCGDVDVASALGKAIVGAATALGDAGPLIIDARQDQLLNIRRAVLELVEIQSKLTSLLASLDAALAERSKAGAAAAALQKLTDDFNAAIQELCNGKTTKPDCGTLLAHGVIEVPISEARIPWDKIRTESFTLERNPGTEGIVAARPEKVEASFDISRRRKVAFSVDFGLTYTEISSPTFEAVETTDEPPVKVPRRTDETTRAGKLALFLTLEPANWPHEKAVPGLQFGTGLDADTPAVFLGLNGRFFGFLNLSGGWTWQHVKELAGGQQEGVALAPGETLRTKDGWDDDWYAGLTISLSNLPFFKPKSS